MTAEAFDNGRILYANQDDNREFITVLACINAKRTALPPTLIYKSDSDTLLDTWIDDYATADLAHFSTLPNGWSNDAFGREWLARWLDF